VNQPLAHVNPDAGYRLNANAPRPDNDSIIDELHELEASGACLAASGIGGVLRIAIVVPAARGPRPTAHSRGPAAERSELGSDSGAPSSRP
jgi:hypothetical protein